MSLDKTTHYEWDRPNQAAVPPVNLSDEMARLGVTLEQIDAVLYALSQLADGKAAAVHSHGIGDVSGLATALAGKMAADKTFKLDDLTDVDGADGAANGQVLAKTAAGWVPALPLALLGSHGHTIADVTGLTSALDNRVRFDAAQSVTAAQQGRAWANVGGSHEDDDRVINGCFDIAQRGVSQTTLGYGSIDRWASIYLGGSVSQLRQAFSAGSTLGSAGKGFYGTQTVSGQSLASHYALRQQRIEDVRSYAGQTITVLGWARRSSGAGDMAVELLQIFGTGGSPSPTVVGIGAQKVSLSSLFQPFAVTVDVPSIAGKTLGTNGNDFLVLNFWASAGSDFNSRTGNLGLQTIGIDLFGIHIRKGVVPVEAVNYYSPRHPALEELLCERYFERSFRYMWQGYSMASNNIVNNIVWRTQKRATPAVALTFNNNINTGVPILQAADRFGVSVSSLKDTLSSTYTYVAEVTADAEL